MIVSSPPARNVDLTRLLVCAALEPAFDGLLLLDLAQEALVPVVDMFIDLLRLRSGNEPVRRIVGSADDDDDLWVANAPYEAARLESMISIPGPVGSGTPACPTVLVVPDLARVSVSVARAATVTLSAPVINVERHGISSLSLPNLYWIAACASADVGRVSPHLLDRFPIRFPAAHEMLHAERVDRVVDAVNGEPEDNVRIPRPPRRWATALQASRAFPEIDSDAIDRVLELHAPAAGIRRPLTLLRLARAAAMLEEKSHVTRAAVEDAAALIRLVIPPNSVKSGLNRDDHPGRPDPEPSDDVPAAMQPEQPASVAAETTAAHVAPVMIGDPAEAFEMAESALQSRGPYPEDTVQPQREAYSLRQPWHRRGRGRPGDRGTIIGTGPASRVHDIAWADTLREAAKFQRVRMRHRSTATAGQGRLLVTGADLRCYRRAPKTDRLLALVLDHTCRRSADWLLPALVEHLRRAYVERAAVCLIEVGGAGGASPLRAERALLRSVLHPRVVLALERGPGSATPLAHGLHLALETLRHALRHGRAPISSAWLTVVTDGLGNVPLSASFSGFIDEPVTDHGIRDALGVARELAQLRNVEFVVIVAPGSPYPSIPCDLAEALGPKCMVVAPGEAW
jgi:magnesium chelatase subunit D